jgi:hypothetical protein
MYSLYNNKVTKKFKEKKKKKLKQKIAGIQVVKHLLSKFETLSSNNSSKKPRDYYHIIS